MKRLLVVCFLPMGVILLACSLLTQAAALTPAVVTPTSASTSIVTTPPACYARSHGGINPCYCNPKPNTPAWSHTGASIGG